MARILNVDSSSLTSQMKNGRRLPRGIAEKSIYHFATPAIFIAIVGNGMDFPGAFYVFDR